MSCSGYKVIKPVCKESPGWNLLSCEHKVTRGKKIIHFQTNQNAPVKKNPPQNKTKKNPAKHDLKILIRQTRDVPIG